jgi:hypothetical protein
MKRFSQMVEHGSSGTRIPAVVLVLVYGGLLIVTNYLVQSQVSVFGLVLTVGLITYPVTFWLTDYACEVYGRRQAYRLVAFGLVLSIIPSLAVSTLQITFGSLLAYGLAHVHEVWAFDHWRTCTAGRHLWMRSLAAQSISELIDTLVFTSVAFFGTLNAHTILSIMTSEYPVKLLYAVVGLAPLYAGVAVARAAGWGLMSRRATVEPAAVA